MTTQDDARTNALVLVNDARMDIHSGNREEILRKLGDALSKLPASPVVIKELKRVDFEHARALSNQGSVMEARELLRGIAGRLAQTGL